MDALTYLKEKARMAKGCEECTKCPISRFNNNDKDNLTCIEFQLKYPQKAIEIVEKWSKENPVKTYKSVFFEKFPNAKTDINGYPETDVSNIFGGKYVLCDKFYKTWDEEYQEPRP